MGEMIKRKVAELEGAALDWAVATVLCPSSEWEEAWKVGWLSNGSPSQDWARGGWLIEEYNVALNVAPSGWSALRIDDDGDEHEQGAGSPLMAACRAIVASELGEEVEIPEELA